MSEIQLPGRPVLPEDKKRTESIKVHITADELQEIRARADGKPLARFMREQCLKAPAPTAEVQP